MAGDKTKREREARAREIARRHQETRRRVMRTALEQHERTAKLGTRKRRAPIARPVFDRKRIASKIAASIAAGNKTPIEVWTQITTAQPELVDDHDLMHAIRQGFRKGDA